MKQFSFQISQRACNRNMRCLCFLLFFTFSSNVWCYEDVSITNYIKTHNGYLFLRNLMTQTLVNETLNQGGPFTLFAPSDGAFFSFGQDKLNALSVGQLKRILEYHVVNGFILTSSETKDKNLTTLLGASILISPHGGHLDINDNNTHVGPTSDIIVQNGVIQPINHVLVPPEKYLPDETIIQVFLLDNIKFKDIYFALLFGNMVNHLENGTYTVFAPTDEAFAKHANRLLDPSQPNANRIYQVIMQYHVIPGEIRSSSLKNGPIFSEVGQAINITLGNGVILNNYARVVEADIYAVNGIIHAIDDVLVPPNIQELIMG
ncbi:transforming growth factor-beta-induced protein ig-h3-like [Dreissena polymorpha]|uniref:FAS1 domain-containing protein n=1 Tax=Dreissena polymorpha TaxID=45954 RepID=A0A9D4K9M5_DREPO|nr:transforming growth factor-beta-induced protein ig-h3-like [Dreissena polymorpha]KAH3835362.1 hypothetical protein DPMN_108711 [Dreissena polymorpha]